MAWTGSEARLAAAKVAADRARSLHPDLPWAGLALAAYYYSRADYDRALEELESVRGALAGESVFYLTLGAIKRRMGDSRARSPSLNEPCHWTRAAPNWCATPV